MPPTYFDPFGRLRPMVHPARAAPPLAWAWLLISCGLAGAAAQGRVHPGPLDAASGLSAPDPDTGGTAAAGSSTQTDISVGSGHYVDVVARTQPRMVKVFGAGGIRGLEAYQSGFLISADGHVLTAWSYVLDTDYATVVLNDGRKFESQIVGSDPQLEIAVLKIDGTNLDHFDLAQVVSLQGGAHVLAFSNLFGVATGDEPTSVQHGVVSALCALNARRGTFQTSYRGTVYILDAMTNNAGAAGGALTDRDGNLAGILGKELRNAQNNTWLNYALPIAEVTESVQNILAGKVQPRRAADRDKPAEPLTLERLGLVLVPDILQKTPPFVESTRLGSPAAQAGLRPDDLIVLVDQGRVQSCQEVFEALSYIDRADPVSLTVLRQQELLNVVLQATP